jgi:hypothetical protein
MDAIRSTELPAPEGEAAAEPVEHASPAAGPEAVAPKPTRVALFTDIAVGDAP